MFIADLSTRKIILLYNGLMAPKHRNIIDGNPRINRALQAIASVTSVSLVEDKNRNGYRYFALKVRSSAQPDQPCRASTHYVGHLTPAECNLLQREILKSRYRPEPDSRVVFLQDRIRQLRRFSRMMMPELQKAARAAGYRMRGNRLMEGKT